MRDNLAKKLSTVLGKREILLLNDRFQMKKLFGSSKTRKRHDMNLRKKAIGLEQLETRQLFHGEPVYYFAPEMSKLALEQALSAYQMFKIGSSVQVSLPKLDKFESEVEAQEQLTNIMADYWRDIFGDDLEAARWAPQVEPFFFSEFSQFDSITSASNQRLMSLDLGSTNVRLDSTNVQIAGVDEHDLVEFSADGRFMFARRDSNAIDIFDVFQAGEIKLVSSIVLDDFVYGLYLRGDRLVCIGADNVSIFDVTSKSTPKLLSRFQLSGWINSSRLVDGQLILMTQEFISYPRPQLKSNIIDGQAVPDSLGRFESREEYIARVKPTILASFLPSLESSEGNQPLGTWQDLVFASSLLSQSTSILVIDIDAETPKFRDTETLMGISSQTIHADNNSVYVVESVVSSTDRSINSNLFRVSIGSDSNGVIADAFGTVRGAVSSSRMMDEFENDLRLVTDIIEWDGTHSANLFVLREQNGKMNEIGRLLDFADDQVPLAAYFNGERAIITTGELQEISFMGFDPLHGIDLSDPTQPVELSELVIPGFSTHLQWIDNNHFIGVGHVEDGTNNWKRQVSLYDLTNLAAPTVISNWVSDYSIIPESTFNRLDPLSINFDVDTGLLVFAEPSSTSRNLWRATIFEPFLAPIGLDPIALPILENRPTTGLQIFKVDPSSNQAPLKRLGSIEANGRVLRGYVHNDSIIAVTSLEAVSRRISEFLQPTNPPVDPPVDPPSQFSDAHATLSLVATREDGSTVSNAIVGDKIWIEVQADSDETVDRGIFQAIVAIEFDRSAFQVVGNAEPLQGYSQGFIAVQDSVGFSQLGGFNESIAPVGEGPNRIARFQVTVMKAGSFDLTVRASSATQESILLYDENKPIRSDNITSKGVQINAIESTSLENSTDVNNDGKTSALDALNVINHLTKIKESKISALVGIETERLDVNADGFVSPVDAIIIINLLNESRLQALQVSSPTAEGEARAVEHIAYGQSSAVEAIELEVQARRRVNRIS